MTNVENVVKIATVVTLQAQFTIKLQIMQGRESGLGVEEKEIRITREIFNLLASNNCTVTEAANILENVSITIQNTAKVQLNDKAEEIFKATFDMVESM